MTNILMVAFDDLNDWSAALGGYAGQVYTPNLDRLSAEGTTFASAFSATPQCNPSRSSTLTGMSPLTTAVLGNDDPLFDFVDPSRTLPALLKEAGWNTVTAGKVFHDLPTTVADQIYDRVLVEQGSSESGEKLPGQVIATTTTQDTGIYIGDINDIKDVQITTAASEFLRGYQPDAAAPLFLSIGITRPHAPHIAPQEFFDLYPLEDIVLPETLPDDLNDIPGFADYFGEPALFDKTRLLGEWPAFVQAYLAAVSFADWMFGQILDALEQSAIADDTMVVAWSDHGYHLGEKNHAGKYTLWEEAARAQLIVKAPGGEATAGELIATPVSLLDLYPTLLDYADVPIPDWAEGQSLRDLISSGVDQSLRGYALTSIEDSHSIRTDHWRYTRYADGSEELYNLARDPEEFVNLANRPGNAPNKAELAQLLTVELDSHPFMQNRSGSPALLDGADGQRLLVSGYGADTLIGSAVDNTYLIRSSTAVVVEKPGGGLDTVLAKTSFTLPSNVEQLIYSAKTTPEGFVRLAGNAAGNLIVMQSGRATLAGGDGDDTLSADHQNDILLGEAGDDSLDGNAADDVLDGGAGNDTLRGGLDNDLYRLSAGRDVIIERAGEGFDRIDVSAWGGVDGVRISMLLGADGLPRSLLLEEIGGTASTIVNLIDGVLTVEALQDGGSTLLLAPGKAVGTSGADAIFGTEGDDSIEGLEQADLLGGAGGRDTLRGGDGDDMLVGGAGDDLLDGGRDADTASYVDAAGGVTVQLNLSTAQVTGGAGTDRLTAIENLLGSAFADMLSGQGKANRLDGGAGDDSLAGSGGTDTLLGGAGTDLLRGGSGADRFVFSMADVGTGIDRIVDFRSDDRLDLTAIDVDTVTTELDHARYDPAAPDAGEVRIYAAGRTTRIEVSIDGDADALVILLTGHVSLTAQNFLL